MVLKINNIDILDTFLNHKNIHKGYLNGSLIWDNGFVFVDTTPYVDVTYGDGRTIKVKCDDGTISDFAFDKENVSELYVSQGIKVLKDWSFANIPTLNKITIDGDVRVHLDTFTSSSNLSTIVFNGDKLNVDENGFNISKQYGTIYAKVESDISDAFRLNKSLEVKEFVIRYNNINSKILESTNERIVVGGKCYNKKVMLYNGIRQPIYSADTNGEEYSAPEGYEWVSSYINSDYYFEGFNTFVEPNVGYTYKLKFRSSVNPSNWNCLFGGRTYLNNTGQSLYLNPNGRFGYFFSNDFSDDANSRDLDIISAIEIEVNKDHLFTYSYDNKRLRKTYTAPNAAYEDSDTPINILRCKTGSGLIDEAAYGNLYYFVIIDENGNKIREFLPVKHIESGKAYLYETVENIIYKGGDEREPL